MSSNTQSTGWVLPQTPRLGPGDWRNEVPAMAAHVVERDLQYHAHQGRVPRLILSRGLPAGGSQYITPVIARTEVSNPLWPLPWLWLCSQTVPPAVLTHIDRSRNCEDIAMAHVVAKQVYNRSHLIPHPIVSLLTLPPSPPSPRRHR